MFGVFLPKELQDLQPLYNRFRESRDVNAILQEYNSKKDYYNSLMAKYKSEVRMMCWAEPEMYNELKSRGVEFPC